MILIPGCTMIPDYVRPEPPVPDTWPETEGSASVSNPEHPIPDSFWMDYYSDPQLQSVIELALANNRDLRLTALNIEKARALYRIQRSELTPSFGMQVTGEKYRLPEQMTEDGVAETVEQYSVQVGFISWELDFFGRIRSLKEKALNQYFALEQTHLAARISLIGTVAQTYLTCASDRENLALARETLKTQQTYLDMIQRSRDLGLATDLDLSQAISQVEAARLDVSRYEGLTALDKNALDLLVGSTVDPDLLPASLPDLSGFHAISPGIPSDVLLQRPDILQAEYLLKSMNANIGAARAAFFPRISLTAGFGTMSPELSGLFTSGSGTWTFAPQLLTPIFAGGLQLARLKAARVDREMAVAEYEKAIQTAFREVSDTLTLRASFAKQIQAQRSLVEALDRTFQLSKARYDAGLDGYLGVLVAQRSLYAAQKGLIALRLASQVNDINLYKALGGGKTGANPEEKTEPAGDEIIE